MTNSHRPRTGRGGLIAVAVASVIAAYALYFPRADGPYFDDWSSFNSLSLEVRSNVLHYGRFPVHNPWVCGGLDLMTNPQNRVFSPFFLADLALPPQWANLCALMLYGTVGFIGCFWLLMALGCGRGTALIGSILFVNGSWFALHYAEGHIPYGAMQLVPLMMFLGTKLGSRRYLITLALAECLFLLDGAIYMFIFTLFMLATMLTTGMIPLAELKAALQRHWELALVVAAAVFTASPKLWPVVANISARQPEIDFYGMPLSLVAKALFYPFQTLNTPMAEHPPYYFHEYGCYLSALGLALIVAVAARSWSFARIHVKYVIAALFWFWVGSGRLSALNPWHLEQWIPLLNNAHVQSRLFLFLFTFFVILVAKALNAVKSRTVFAVLGVLLVTESLVVRNYPMTERPPHFEDLPQTALITSTTVATTGEYAWTPQHYLRGNTGTAECYEPSFRPLQIKSANHPDYRGEVYPLDPGAGVARLQSYTPGSIIIRYELTTPTRLELNTNALFGWRVVSGNATVQGRGAELLVVEPQDLGGVIELQYWPAAMPWLFVAFAAGLTLFTWLWRQAPARDRVAR